MAKFQDIKQFASEIHTEIHLIKPVLKLLGYAYESKPKFFEEQIKGPDAALFASDEDYVRSSSLWGTEEYYAHARGLLVLKRYGRNLEEGISGFYLEFENRIPMFQTAYLLKKTRVPWGILTNGQHWMLIRRPVAHEATLIDLDLEKALFENGKEALHLFFHIFSLRGLLKTLPEILEQERTDLIALLKEKRTFARNAVQGLKKKLDVYPRIVNVCQEIFSDKEFPATETYLQDNGLKFEKQLHVHRDNISDYNISDITAYLFNKKNHQTSIDFEEVFLQKGAAKLTKEQLLSLKILDMTPNFGTLAAKLIEGIAYLSFILPYKERNTFVTEWENETSLTRYIVDRLLFGIEKSHPTFDILHHMMKSRFRTRASNYKLGNPLIGMSLSEIPSHFDARNQLGLFGRNPEDLLKEFRGIFRRYFSLSERIKEDVQLREELEVTLKRYSKRIHDVMDVITTTYFSKAVDHKKIQDMLSNMDSDETVWKNFESQNWFVESKDIAKRNGFFHLEIEFPFLLNDAFDFIFMQPALQHIWEDTLPLIEITKAYIKRGMPYLKSEGTMVLVMDDYPEEVLIRELSQSKRYEMEVRKGFILLHKKQIGHL
ncbi:MAG TPA: hypothetical protein VMT62_18065 [Syntrophorhabdaceae bacterium]|nr:hypothetical protein [Syntrophorhabdaceae bacterium]